MTSTAKSIADSALKFNVLAECSTTKARVAVMSLPHADVDTPVFMPVGTQGTLKGLLPEQLEKLDCRSVAWNTRLSYRLLMRPPWSIQDHAWKHLSSRQSSWDRNNEKGWWIAQLYGLETSSFDRFGWFSNGQSARIGRDYRGWSQVPLSLWQLWVYVDPRTFDWDSSKPSFAYLIFDPKTWENCIGFCRQLSELISWCSWMTLWMRLIQIRTGSKKLDIEQSVGWTGVLKHTKGWTHFAMTQCWIFILFLIGRINKICFLLSR